MWLFWRLSRGLMSRIRGVGRGSGGRHALIKTCNANNSPCHRTPRPGLSCAALSAKYGDKVLCLESHIKVRGFLLGLRFLREREREREREIACMCVCVRRGDKVQVPSGSPRVEIVSQRYNKSEALATCYYLPGV